MNKPATRKITPESKLDVEVPILNKKEKMQLFVEGRSMSSVMGVLTVYALFGDDLRLMLFSKDVDDFFYSISLIALLAFVLEFSLNCYSKKDYVFGFYFMLDFVSTLSLVPDIGWIWDEISEGGDEASQAATLKAGRASRAGTKAGRIVRIVRLVRMVRIVKLYKMKNKNDEEHEQEISEPSKVGKTLTELTTRKLILMVLAMIIVLPLIDGSLDEDYNEYQQFGMETLHRYSQDYNASGTISESEMKNTVLNYVRNAGPILELKIAGYTKEKTNGWLQEVRFQPLNGDGDFESALPYTLDKNPKTGWTASMMRDDAKSMLRSSEYTSIEAVGCYNAAGKCTDCSSLSQTCHSLVVFDTASSSQTSALINILKTFFIMLTLGTGAVLFTRDAQTLVIGPIERMMSLVNKLADNPLGSTKSKKQQYESDEPQGDYETNMLEETLSKIGGLLQVGFGVAGTEIIAKNMGGAGELNVMIPGKKITSIFGFGIIEGFTEMCSVLEENIITYINTIADIVHTDANTYYGAANKNIGCAFLLAWKICNGTLPGLRDPRDTGNNIMDESTKKDKRKDIFAIHQGNGKKSRNITPTELVDSALAAVLKMRVDLESANTTAKGSLRQFCENPNVISTFGKDFQVHLGFGLHIGWAIEGAIGSKYKIDASYLSPNVNMAARLEAATGQFSVPMLLSEWFVNELSAPAKRLCRKIDRVTVKGSTIPMEMWTFDIGTYPSEGIGPHINDEGCQQPINFVGDGRFTALRKGINPDFFEYFDKAVTDYLAGNWMDGKQSLEKCLELHPKDGPTALLLRILGESNFKSPSNWPGYRELTEK